MKRTNTCPKCGSGDVIAGNWIGGQGAGGPTYVATYRNPTAFIFKGRSDSKVSPYVCAECGYIELYADSPEKLDTSKT